MKWRPLSIIIASILSGHAVAEELRELELTEVKAEKSHQELLVTIDDLENIQAEDVKDALSVIPGVTVANGLRYAQKTYVRGLEEGSANVTIDGARQDGQLFHHSGNQLVDASMLKAVEVQLGATSVLSGYGANTGSIAYETKDPNDLLKDNQRAGFKLSTSADTGTEFRQVNLAAYGRLTDKLSGLLLLSKSENGDIEVPNGDPIVSKHSELKSGIAKLVYDIDHAQQIKFGWQRYDEGGNRDFSGEKPGSTTLEKALGYTGYIRDTYTLDYLNDSDNPLLNLKASLYYNEKVMEREASEGINWNRDANGKWFEDGIASNPARDYKYKTLGLNVRNTSIVNDIHWTYGIETFKSEQEIVAHGLQTVKPLDGSTRTNDLSVSNGPEAELASGYVQASLMVGQVELIPGVRYDHYSLGGAYDSSFSQLSPKFSALWSASNTLDLRLGYGRIFKGPGLPETLMLNNDVKQGTNVEAETGNHLEFNIDYDLTNSLGLDSATAFLNIYQYNIDNYFHPTKNLTLSSNSDVENKGFETGITIKHADLYTYLNWAFVDGTRDYGSYESDLLTTGTHLIKLGLNYRVTSYLTLGWDSEFATSADLTGVEQDRSGALESTAVKKAGYGVSDLWVRYEPTQIEGLKLNFGIDNIFDKEYQNHNTFGNYWGNAKYNDNEVGRNFKLTLSYQY